LTDTEQKLIDFGSSIAKNKGHISDEIYNAVAEYYTAEELVVLIAFAGQMIATNIFNNVIETDIDEYLTPYLPPTN
jgi:alkylhydroperoxidase family enzyme